MKKVLTIIAMALCVMSLPGCDSTSTTPEQAPVYDMSGFAKGADVSWLTEMEDEGYSFYSSDGVQTECLHLLRDMGLNAVRLRVWVNPSEGWNAKGDVLAKAYRASQLGFRIMVDFHYSDTWADPGTQDPPAQWATYDLGQMKEAVAAHTTEVLTSLKEKGINVEWVQVGNETRTGMLWPVGKVSDNADSFAQLVNSGYSAVKSVYPDTKVIVHVDSGNDSGISQWLFDALKSSGGKWDVIGLSLYPEDDSYSTMVSDCLANMKSLASRYSCEVMVCEVGMDYDSQNASKCISSLYEGARQIDACLGVFYWEPECYGGWKDYRKGAFTDDGRPSGALDCFMD